MLVLKSHQTRYWLSAGPKGPFFSPRMERNTAIEPLLGGSDGDATKPSAQLSGQTARRPGSLSFHQQDAERKNPERSESAAWAAWSGVKRIIFSGYICHGWDENQAKVVVSTVPSLQVGCRFRSGCSACGGQFTLCLQVSPQSNYGRGWLVAWPASVLVSCIIFLKKALKQAYVV